MHFQLAMGLSGYNPILSPGRSIYVFAMSTSNSETFGTTANLRVSGFFL